MFAASSRCPDVHPQDPTGHHCRQTIIQCGPDEKHEDVFEEMIEHDLPDRRLGVDFGEQKLEGRASSGRAFRGTTNGSGSEAVRGFNIPTPNRIVGFRN
jgi:hypothetical protein